MMKKEQLILTKEDFEFLTECYHSDHMSIFNKTKLLEELREAKIVAGESLPSNVVRNNSDVLVCNMDKSQTFNVHIVSDGSVAQKVNGIAISDPLAIALFGYQTGAIVEWEMRDGISRFQIISVRQGDTEPAMNPFIV